MEGNDFRIPHKAGSTLRSWTKTDHEKSDSTVTVCVTHRGFELVQLAWEILQKHSFPLSAGLWLLHSLLGNLMDSARCSNEVEKPRLES